MRLQSRATTSFLATGAPRAALGRKKGGPGSSPTFADIKRAFGGGGKGGAQITATDSKYKAGPSGACKHFRSGKCTVKTNTCRAQKPLGSGIMGCDTKKR